MANDYLAVPFGLEIHLDNQTINMSVTGNAWRINNDKKNSSTIPDDFPQIVSNATPKDMDTESVPNISLPSTRGEKMAGEILPLDMRIWNRNSEEKDIEDYLDQLEDDWLSEANSCHRLP
ncbi:hypothetical protein TNCV_4521581 [Trichonephila clavipes]|nr:hypothetical protein TNCV_4521581 [Trichonephila clavipes]